jgi:hypothetical protein
MSDTPKDTPKSDPARKGGKGRPPEVTPRAFAAATGSAPANPEPGTPAGTDQVAEPKAPPPSTISPAATVPAAAPSAAIPSAAAPGPAGPAAAGTPTGGAPPAAANPAAGSGATAAPAVPPKPRPEAGPPPRPAAAATPGKPPERHDRLALPVAVVSGIVALAALGITLADRGRLDLARIDQLERGQSAVQSALQPVQGQVQALASQMGQSGERFTALETALRERSEAQSAQFQALRDQINSQRSDREELRQAADARIEAAEQSLSQRIEGARTQLEERINEAEAALGPRFAAVENAMQQRVAAAEQASAERLAARDRELDARFESLQQRETRLTAAERRLSVLVASAATESALLAGRPLGRALSGLPGEAPQALARYSGTAPPTEASLRLSFDDAARGARAQSQPSTDGQTVWESAAQRLGNLVTVRRGEDVVWGDAIGGEIETARRSLEAGDLAAAVQKVESLPGPVRSAMESWLDQARGLLAARSALETLRTGGQG